MTPDIYMDVCIMTTCERQRSAVSGVAYYLEPRVRVALRESFTYGYDTSVISHPAISAQRSKNKKKNRSNCWNAICFSLAAPEQSILPLLCSAAYGLEASSRACQHSTLRAVDARCERDGEDKYL